MRGLSKRQAFVKRGFDIAVATIGLVLFGWLILLLWVIATIDTRGNGFFTQERVGLNGRVFRIIKIRTMRVGQSAQSTVTVYGDSRITRVGRVFRAAKLDELPQLVNVLLGDMSIVGPRPDVPGYADQLVGDDRIIVTVRPGITGPASVHFRNEERLLAEVEDPETFNRETLFPLKIAINKGYVEHYSLVKDIKYILQTIWGKPHDA